MWSSLKGKIILRIVVLFLSVSILGLNGCANIGTYNPATGHREFILISSRQEVAMGNDIHRQLESEYKIVENGPLAEKVRRIGSDVAAVADRQEFEYQFYLIDKDEMNAFTVPGGRIYVFKGLAEKLKTDDAIAAVLAHEVGHNTAKHSVKKFQTALGYSLLSYIFFKQLHMKENTRRIAALGTGVLSSIIFAAYSRQDEYQADMLGLRYMSLAGYNPQGMVDAFEILEAEKQRGGEPEFLRTHPHLEDRIKRAKQLIETKGYM